MKKILILFLTLSLFLITSCSKPIKFERIDKVNDGFHKIDEAEKIGDGIIYYSGDKLLYDKDNVTAELADNVKSLWRENNDIYYDSNNILYKYSFETNETTEIVEKPYNILGKYNDNIISYHARTVYSINGTAKAKLFENGYYLNKAILYDGKIYGIPASNIYEYNIDTLEVKKITDNPEMSYFKIIEGELYIITVENKKDKKNYTYSKLTDNKLEKVFTIEDIESITEEKPIKEGMFISTSKASGDSVNGNQLLYIQGEKIKKVDTDHSYNIVGLIDNKLCYYKNKYNYGTYENNLSSFYLYDGKDSTKAFDLDVGFFENITGYEYEGGLLIEVAYESSTIIYKYDGKEVKKLQTPDCFYRIINLDVIDNKAYISYSDGEESMMRLGTIINLDLS